MRKLSIEELEQVHGGGEICPEPKEKGNNGWGNGGEDPPPGASDENTSPQVDSKIADVDR